MSGAECEALLRKLKPRCEKRSSNEKVAVTTGNAHDKRARVEAILKRYDGIEGDGDDDDNDGDEEIAMEEDRLPQQPQPQPQPHQPPQAVVFQSADRILSHVNSMTGVQCTLQLKAYKGRGMNVNTSGSLQVKRDRIALILREEMEAAREADSAMNVDDGRPEENDEAVAGAENDMICDEN